MPDRSSDQEYITHRKSTLTAGCKQTEKSCMVYSNGAPTHGDGPSHSTNVEERSMRREGYQSFPNFYSVQIHFFQNFCLK